MRGSILLVLGALCVVWGVMVLADAGLNHPLGRDMLFMPPIVALVLCGIGGLLSWVGFRLVRQ